jgi:hypothetical protein
MTVNSLSAGTYNLLIVDDNGCERTKTVSIGGNVEVSSYQVYNVCDSDLSNYGELLTKGPKQMLLEGFYELTTDDINCVLNETIFEASVTVSGITTTQEFYTGNTLNDYPTTGEWENVIETLLLGYDGIGSVTFNEDDNKMTISTDCNSEVSLNDADVVINMVIYYDISCVSCNECCMEINIIKCDDCQENPLKYLLNTFINGLTPTPNTGSTITIIPSGKINGYYSYNFVLDGNNYVIYHEDGYWYLSDNDTLTILATFESDSKCPESNGWDILAPEILGVITTEIPCGII